MPGGLGAEPLQDSCQAIAFVAREQLRRAGREAGLGAGVKYPAGGLQSGKRNGLRHKARLSRSRASPCHERVYRHMPAANKISVRSGFHLTQNCGLCMMIRQLNSAS